MRSREGLPPRLSFGLLPSLVGSFSASLSLSLSLSLARRRATRSDRVCGRAFRNRTRVVRWPFSRSRGGCGVSNYSNGRITMWQKKLARYGAFFLGRPNLPSPPPHRCGDHRDHPELWRFGQEESRAEEKACGERTASNSTKPRTVHVHFEVLFTFHLIHSASCSPPTRHLRASRSRPFWASARTPPHTHATDPRPSRVPTSVLGVYSPPHPPLGRPAGSWIPGRSPPSPRWTAASFLVRDLGVDLKVGG